MTTDAEFIGACVNDALAAMEALLTEDPNIYADLLGDEPDANDPHRDVRLITGLTALSKLLLETIHEQGGPMPHETLERIAGTLWSALDEANAARRAIGC